MNNDKAQEKIEILGLDLFVTHAEEIGIVSQFQRRFGHILGWHYYLDIAWIIREVQVLPRGSLILDAGAGSGLLQFILAELGYNVISVDFMVRRFSTTYADRFAKVIYYLNNRSRTFANRYTKHIKESYTSLGSDTASRVFGFFSKTRGSSNPVSLIEQNRFKPDGRTVAPFEGDAVKSCGRIFLYTCDLKEMPLLPDGLVDGVVSVSALEHNDHENFRRCVEEILRVTRPAGRLFVTVNASLSKDWYHAPSKGWCYGEATIKKLFGLAEDVKSNFSRREVLFRVLCEEGNELHRRLDPVYFNSGDNGMPWGKWDPQYQPVGIVKVNNRDS